MTAGIWTAAWLLLAGAASAQEREPAPPVFGSDVGVVAVDVSVVGKDGEPVRDLAPADFQLTVEGKPRRVLYADFISQAVAAQPAAPPAAVYSSNEGLKPGRLIMLAVDQNNIRMGAGRPVADAANRLIDQLTPADRLGLVSFPTPGPGVDFTSEFGSVRQALKKVVGRGSFIGRQVTLPEALAFTEGDQLRWEQVEERVCPEAGAAQEEGNGRGFGNGNDRPACLQTLHDEAARVAETFRRQSVASIRALLALFQALRQIDGPKTVVLVSEGLTSENRDDYMAIARAASEARASLYVLRLQGSNDPLILRENDDVEGQFLRTDGLQAVSTMARGTTFHVSGTGAGIFERIARELSGYYLLGVEPEDSDRDGQDHEIKVKVQRPGVAVRARRRVSFPEAVMTDAQAAEILRSTLRAPIPAVDLPVRVSTYALQDAATSKVKLLISADVGRGAGTPTQVSVAYVLLDGKGKVAASAIQKVKPEGHSPDGLPFLGALSVDPGLYTLKFAAIDGRRRRGSVDHPVKAALTAGGGLQIGDLMLAAPTSAPGAAMRPGVDVQVSGALTSYVELYGRDAERLEQAAVRMEIAEAEDGAAILSGVARPASGEAGRQAMQATLAVGLLPPGEYVARAVVSVGAEAVGHSSRPFRVVPGGAASAGAPRGIPLAGLAPSIARYQREDALKPEVLHPFLDQLEPRGGALSAPERAALKSAREARFDELSGALSGAQNETLALTFLRGLGLYAQGNLAAAATQFKASLKHSSEFFPAAFYLGACSAADGQDLQAAGAWQTALIAESEQPAIYTLSADALLRANKPEDAADILAEATQKWPADEGFRRRLGIAYAMVGKEEEALKILTSYLDTHGTDTGALFVTMRLLFQSYLAGRTSDPLAGDRERLTRYARTYVDAKGPQQELVAHWLKYLKKEPK